MTLLYVRYSWLERLYGPVWNAYGRQVLLPQSLPWGDA